MEQISIRTGKSVRICFSSLLVLIACAVYGAKLRAGPPELPLPIRSKVSPVDLLATVKPPKNGSITQGWLPAELTCQIAIPKNKATNLAFFFFMWRTNGEQVAYTIIPSGMPQGAQGSLEWCNYPRGTWYRLDCVTNGQIWLSTNWADIPMGFYRVRW